MNLLELFFISLGLSADAFAVAICKGLPIKKVNVKNAGTIGLYFGAFQALMPLIGYFLSIKFQEKIAAFDHWIAFMLLGFIGLQMIKESKEPDLDCDCHEESDSLDFKTMLALSIATSIDALAVGITFACLQVNILPAVSFIGFVTFSLSMVGVKIGNILVQNLNPRPSLPADLYLLVWELRYYWSILF